MAVEKLIVDHIDTWTTARQTRSTAGRGSSGKIDLYGIKKLRELILELAVRGKLVPQDSNDEPASVLLKRIAAEKAELVKQGKIKKSKPLPEISEDDEPFDLPKGWEWVRFGDICEIERGGSPRPIKDYLTSEKDGLNWIKIGDTDIGGKYITSAEEKIKPSGLHKTRMVYPGDFLLTNSMSFGRPYITLIEGCIHDGWLRISPPSSLDNDFLYQLLSSPFIAKAFKEKASGAVVLNLNADKVRETFILVPPFSEQQRIVTKANELMSLCDQLEQHTLTSLDAHQQLVETLLTTLTNSQNADELAENWARISEHFDTLFTTEASIDTLKQTILQLAVMGKLVPQDPNDEPASELLKRIAQEKAQLVKDGKMKKQKPLPPISDEEKPFVTPNHWEWVRFGEIGEIKGGGTPSKNNSAFWEGDIPWVSPKDMKVDYISKSELSISQDAVQNSSVTLISEESLLFVVRGMILAHTFPVAIAKKEVTINQDMKAISTDLYHPDFLIKMMKACSIRVLSLVDRSSHGTCKLVSDKLFSLVLPL
ncbi:restriction endonuclease subunit S, partial [Salmonella enterica]|nr:restriction endonuclease subunit S [Salmonella enterica]